jgi:hypothetical protein
MADNLQGVISSDPPIRNNLVEAGVIIKTRSNDGGDQFTVDADMNEVRELLFRGNISYLIQAMYLWQGGIYAMLNLITPSLREAQVARCTRLFIAIVALRNAAASSMSEDRDFVEFAAAYFWADGPLYLQLLQAIFRGEIDTVASTVTRIFGGILHEKGCENAFKSLRRCVKKTTENGVVSISRLYQAYIKGVPKCWPNVEHQPVPAEAYDEFYSLDRPTMQSLLHYTIPQKAGMLYVPDAIFNASR